MTVSDVAPDGSDRPDDPELPPATRGWSQPGPADSTPDGWRVDRPGEFEPSPILGPLLRGVPEFVPSYLTMVAGCEDDPGEPTILMELADFVSGRLTILRQERPLIARVLDVVEGHLEAMDDDPEGCELVAYAFFDSFSPELRATLAPMAGPRSRMLLEELDGSWLDTAE